jgi:hypothetical protein
MIFMPSWRLTHLLMDNRNRVWRSAGLGLRIPEEEKPQPFPQASLPPSTLGY